MIPALLIALGCGDAGAPDSGTPTGEPPEPREEILGNGVDDDVDGWQDEYGVGTSARFAPRIEGGFDALDSAQEGAGSWLAAGARKTPDTDGRTVQVWSDIAYVAPYELPGPAEDARFGSALALVGGYLAVANAENGFEMYALPPGVPVGIVHEGSAGPVGDVLVAADLGRLAGPSLLASEGDATTLLFEASWYTPRSPGGWSGALGGGAADADGDGGGNVLLAEVLSPGSAGSAWIVDGLDVAGVVPVAEVGVEIAPAGDVTWVGNPVGAGDVDGDGYDDLLVPASAADLRGCVRLLAGPFPGDVTVDAAFAVVTGTYDGEACVDVEPVGDVVAIGCAGGGLPGRVAIFPLGDLAGALAVEDATVTWVGESTGAPLGGNLAGAADLSGDLEPDLAAQGLGITVLPGPLWR